MWTFEADFGHSVCFDMYVDVFQISTCILVTGHTFVFPIVSLELFAVSISLPLVHRNLEKLGSHKHGLEL